MIGQIHKVGDHKMSSGTLGTPGVTPFTTTVSDTSARLDVLAALTRNSTSRADAWRTWDSDTAAAPVAHSTTETPISDD